TLPRFDLIDLGPWNGLADFSFPFAHQLARTENQGPIRMAVGMGMDCRHGHDGLSGPHLADQQNRLLTAEGFASCFDDVRRGFEWIARQIESWQRVAAGDVQRL